MVEERINDIITEVENQETLVRMKLKTLKKELKEIDKKIRDNKFVDEDMVRNEKARLNKELREVDTRLYKLNKVLYRLRVCNKILNNEEE